MTTTCVLLVLTLASVALPPLRLFNRSRDAEPAKTESKKQEPPKAEERPRKDERRKKDEPAKEPAGAFEVEAMRNIAYRDDRDADPARHKLDLYFPKGQSSFPVVFFVHGGGWHKGDKELYAPLGQVLARNGLGVVVINYRLSPAVKFPAHIEDVAKAFAWVHGNIERYGGRRDRVLVAGHSAGGHLVSLLACDERYLKAEGRRIADIRGVITMSGVYAIDEIYGTYSSVFGRSKEARRDASPIHHVNGKQPPFCILHADRDLPTIGKVSEQFYEELRKAKCDARLHQIPGRTHITLITLTRSDDDPTTLAMFDFIERHTEWKRPAANSKEASR